MFNQFDVIVIGAGHAGCEAALAAARLGANTVLLTISLDSLAWMPCNSSVGGGGRGQLLRELDALGGQMARVADSHTLHSRRSNISKGPAVQAPFAIVDRRQYQLEMKYLLEKTENLSLRQALVTDIYPEGSLIVVESAFAETFRARAVVLSAGTFMRAEVAFGDVREPAGRYAEVSAPEISESLSRLGFRLGRFKTGTSPRIAAKSVDLDKMERQSPDEKAEAISFWSDSFSPKALCCYKTHTTQKTKDLIDKNIARSVLFSEDERFVGARYCPSIEDRVLHSPERERHPIFLQPQDSEASELYIQGLSTSLPLEVQIELVRSVEGLGAAEVMRPGYAVMYDFIYPDQLTASLETKPVEGLFSAGQINGTSGYEEAAAQGLVAGINAALKVQGKKPLVLDRSQAYIGVLIDDLVTKGVDEPYRMFTSRAEYRLLLRSDNADLRLAPLAYKLGLLDAERFAKVKEKQKIVAASAKSAAGQTGTAKRSKGQAAKARAADKAGADQELAAHIAREIEAQALYAGYIAQELKKIEKFRAAEEIKLSADIDYAGIPGLSNEAVEKLCKVKPASVGQAARIPGLRQTDIQILHIYGKKFHIELGGRC